MSVMPSRASVRRAGRRRASGHGGGRPNAAPRRARGLALSAAIGRLAVSIQACLVMLPPGLLPAATAEPAPDDSVPFSIFQAPADGPNTDVDADRIGDDLAARLAEEADPEVRSDPARVRVLVSGVASQTALAAVGPFALHRELRVVPGFVATVSPEQVGALAQVPGVDRVELDGQTVAMDVSGDATFGLTAARRDAALRAPGNHLDGSGVGVCIADTGVYPSHEQFAGRKVTFVDLVEGKRGAYDDNGHGTHVAGIAAGGGGGNLRSARAGGVAGGASLYVAKALSGDGTGLESDAVAAVEWCTEQAAVGVILLAFGAAVGDGGDLLSRAVAAAVTQGIVVAVAAGNAGDGLGGITSPAGSPAALAVGAASDASASIDGQQSDPGVFLAPFSARGSAIGKPDLVGPGVTVRAAAAGTADGYVTMSGTSMSAAYVAGAVAVGLQQVPNATPTEVAQALRLSAADRGPTGPDTDWGAGLLDVRAFLARLSGTSASAPAVPGVRSATRAVTSAGPVTIPIAVAVRGRPLAATVIVTADADLDVELYDPTGTLRSESRCPGTADLGCGSGRQETVGVTSAEAGTWQVVVLPGEPGATGAFSLDVMTAPASGSIGGPRPH